MRNHVHHAVNCITQLVSDERGNLPPIRSIDDPPWEEEPRTVLVCEKCERAESGLAGAEELPDDETFVGYCDRHGKHNEFYTMEV